jgi:protein subunit release factor A
MVPLLHLRLRTSEQLQISDMDEVKIEGHSNLSKDLDSGAVVNKDKVAYQRYLQSKKNMKEMQDTVSDINKMKEEMSEIKTLLKELLKKNV